MSIEIIDITDTTMNEEDAKGLKRKKLRHVKGVIPGEWMEAIVSERMVAGSRMVQRIRPEDMIISVEHKLGEEELKFRIGTGFLMIDENQRNLVLGIILGKAANWANRSFVVENNCLHNPEAKNAEWIIENLSGKGAQEITAAVNKLNESGW